VTTPAPPALSRPALAKVVLAIAAFRSDAAVIALLQQVFAAPDRDFAAVVVVDSLGSGAIARAIADAGWPVRYDDASHNLGSAGNLSRRLEFAAETQAAWCFTLNADGLFDRALIADLVGTGDAGGERVGAVYPQRRYTRRGNAVIAPMTSISATPRFETHAPPDAPDAPDATAWDSSNGALYALAPVRAGLRPPADFWMGWEDLAYGWLLTQHGWTQLRSATATLADDYEYREVALFGRRLFITDKPAWYAYYVIRNLVLFSRRSRMGAAGARMVATRLGREVLLTVLYRTSKWQRLRLLAAGFVAGLRGRTGKARVP